MVTPRILLVIKSNCYFEFIFPGVFRFKAIYQIKGMETANFNIEIGFDIYIFQVHLKYKLV